MSLPRYETFTLTRQFSATTDRVFGAFADPAARAIWSPPSPDEGVEVETLYHAIDTGKLIHFTEILKVGDAIEGSSLVTVVLQPNDGTGTALTVILQAISLGDPTTIDEMHQGWDASLGNLAAWLTPA